MIRRKALGWAALAVAALAASGRAQGVAKFGEWVESVKVGGDFRLRHEAFDKKTAGQVERTRQRMRLRLGAEFGLPNRVTAGVRLATGEGASTSTNQSFDNFSSQKSIFVDRAFLSWQPCPEHDLRLTGGKMQIPFWTTYTSDVVWDDDFAPEGFAQQFSSKLGDATLFANALQMVADEDSTVNGLNQERNQWMFGEQVGVELPLPLLSRLKVGVSHYEWLNEKAGTFSQTALEGNRRTGGVLRSKFSVGEATAELATWAGDWPVVLSGTLVKNFGAQLSPKEDKGYQAGVRVGRAQAKGSVEVAYYYKNVETDATVADMADSDFGDGGTNRKGHILWIGYNPVSWANLRAKYFVTRVNDASITGDGRTPATGDDRVNRLQVDASVRF